MVYAKTRLIRLFVQDKLARNFAAIEGRKRWKPFPVGNTQKRIDVDLETEEM